MISNPYELAPRESVSRERPDSMRSLDAPDVLSLIRCARCCELLLSSDPEDAILSRLESFGLGAASAPLVAPLRKER
jgi:hypothetical protein